MQTDYPNNKQPGKGSKGIKRPKVRKRKQKFSRTSRIVLSSLLKKLKFRINYWLKRKIFTADQWLRADLQRVRKKPKVRQMRMKDSLSPNKENNTLRVPTISRYININHDLEREQETMRARLDRLLEVPHAFQKDVQQDQRESTKKEKTSPAMTWSQQ